MASQIEEQMRVLMARREQMKRDEEAQAAPSIEEVEDAELVDVGDEQADQVEVVDEAPEMDDSEGEHGAPQVTGEDEKDLVMIYHAKCLRCQHLTSTGTRIFNACHFSNGNVDCPAKSIRIVIGINFERAANLVAQAMLNGDTVKLKSLMEKLESRDEIVRKRVMAMASQMLASKSGSGQ